MASNKSTTKRHGKERPNSVTPAKEAPKEAPATRSTEGDRPALDELTPSGVRPSAAAALAQTLAQDESPATRKSASLPQQERPDGAAEASERAEPAGPEAQPDVRHAPAPEPAAVIPSAAQHEPVACPPPGPTQTAPAAPPPEPQPAPWQPPPGPLRAGIPSMYVVQITPELAPVAKVGGLADVVFGLSRELAIRGHSVEIILPKYDCLRYDQIWGLHPCYQDLWVPWWGGRVHCTVLYGEVHGRKCYFIEPHCQENYFNRGKFYGDKDDDLRFAFFSRAAMEFLYKSGKRPEVIHCHDWQTGLVPVFQWEIYQHLGMHHPRICYTIHNFKHQGTSGEYLLWATELGRPQYYFHPDRLRDNQNPSAVSAMKGGIVYSNFVTTVSPNHAWEAKQGQGHGLENTLHVHHVKYGGIVNGIDYDVWNPEVDHHIPVRYGAGNIERKYDNKRGLRNRFWLADSVKPIISYIGRLDDQKGLELIKNAVHWALRNSAQFVLLGTAPDARVGNDFWQLKRQLNDSPDCHIELGFNEELSHLIYAGADMMLVPSRFEPCGLTQLVAMRYGTVPVVRAVGGLVDTVFDKDNDWRPLDQRNGYVFSDYSQYALESTLQRAVRCYYEYPQHFRDLMLNGMRYDYSWNIPGQHYLNIYDHIREK